MLNTVLMQSLRRFGNTVKTKTNTNYTTEKYVDELLFTLRIC